jgi:3-polyprenyl-4-hydroxybenzoate decarboxylase
MNIVYCVTGSLEEKSSSKIIKELGKYNHIIYPIYTESTHYFPKYENQNRKYLPSKLNTEDEVEAYYEQKRIWHYDVANWADILLIAPCTANTIGKIVNGICDSPQLSLIATFIGMNKKLYVAPTMNTNMFNNPFVQNNIDKLSKVAHIIYPTVKELACGDFGIGALSDINAIIDVVNNYQWNLPLNFINKDFSDYLPKHNEPGSFGFKRKYDIHTGVDIYCKDNDKVYAVEEGEIIDKGVFTGKKANYEWWNETNYVVIKGKSGYVLYGEINDCIFNIGDKIKQGDFIGNVKAVLDKDKIRNDIRNHSNAMLHIELYKEYNKPIIWNLNEKRDKNLLDPTPYLKNCII